MCSPSCPHKFGLAIRKLIDYDFGNCDDLDMSLMQKEFTEDVIRPLEEMEHILDKSARMYELIIVHNLLPNVLLHN